ncbi:spore coat protein GerQ [Paenisporosarcina indica]|uniref:spore coat protein GerQ n=1 Tax=Paenisporosarcina indica TaxID=650093 RepID=UPI000950225E|nr:spore coat protein GerQ [Paenisporosarcina indica]
MVQYYWNPAYAQQMQQPFQGQQPFQPQQQQQLPPAAPVAPRPRQPMAEEESYIENILRFNKGKVGTFYLTFPNNREWNAKVVTGVVEAAGKDHVIVSETSGKRYLLLMIYLDYVTFDEEITYFQ